jgi:hypothetical protein
LCQRNCGREDECQTKQGELQNSFYHKFKGWDFKLKNRTARLLGTKLGLGWMANFLFIYQIKIKRLRHWHA